MRRRIVASALWAYFGWYLAAHLAQFFGLPAFIAPLGGVAMLGLAWLDLRASIPLLRTSGPAQASAEASHGISE